MLTEIRHEPSRLLWQRVDADHAMPIAAGDMLQLEARRRAGHLVSSAMRCDLVSPDARAGRFELRTRLPLRLTLRHARHDWCARVVPGGMTVDARLTRAEAPAVQATLVDLSVGGCRLASGSPRSSRMNGSTCGWSSPTVTRHCSGSASATWRPCRGSASGRADLRRPERRTGAAAVVSDLRDRSRSRAAATRSRRTAALGAVTAVSAAGPITQAGTVQCAGGVSLLSSSLPDDISNDKGTRQAITTPRIQ